MNTPYEKKKDSSNLQVVTKSAVPVIPAIQNAPKIEYVFCSETMNDLDKKIGKIETLLENNGDFNARDESGQTALHVICGLLKNDYGDDFMYSIYFRDEMLLLIYKSTVWPAERNHRIRKKIKEIQEKDGVAQKEFTYSKILYYINKDDDKLVVRMCKALYDRAIECCKKMLISSDMDVDAEDNKGMTALHIACQQNNTEYVIKLLLRHGANANAQDFEKNTPLHYLCNTTNSTENRNGVLALLDANPLINLELKNKENELALHIACKNNCVRDVQSILSGRNFGSFDHSAEDIRGNTPLHIACNAGYVEIASSLLHVAANVNKRDRDGEYPLLSNLIRDVLPVRNESENISNAPMLATFLEALQYQGARSTKRGMCYETPNDLSKTNDIIMMHWREHWGSDVGFFKILCNQLNDASHGFGTNKLLKYLEKISVDCDNEQIQKVIEESITSTSILCRYPQIEEKPSAAIEFTDESTSATVELSDESNSDVMSITKDFQRLSIKNDEV